MTVFRDNRASPLTEAAVVPSSFRETYQFEQRVDLMAQRMNESGVPNEYFPFMASWCVTHPEWNTLGENFNRYDAVCVLKGLRPVALLPCADLDRSDPFNDYLLRSLEEAGFVVRKSPYSSDLIVGEGSRVEAVQEVIRKRVQGGDFSEEYHRAFGRALGYPERAIERYVTALDRGQSPLDVSVIELAFPADGESSLRVTLPNGRVVGVC
ncbi:MAG: hypothetical protein RL518_1858 [Pseudomonadota bacterium]